MPPRHVRQRKLTKATLQQVLREDQIESAEYDSNQSHQHVETGVERHEENEYHLQAALASTGGGKDSEEIPAPPAEKTVDIDYDALYSLRFKKPATYIRVSYTVEEVTGCQYDMDSEDDTWLQAYNQGKSASQKLSEDDFEKIVEVFEDTTENHTPFAAVDNTLIPFETMSAQIKLRLPSKLLDVAEHVYGHWKDRKQASGNKSIQPGLKFEINKDDDDADPYVCFRRREVRQTRKTRARDVQSVDKLKKLRKELEDARHLVALTHSREVQKQAMMLNEKTIFDQRYKVKVAKTKLGIKGDDEDFINQKVRRSTNRIEIIADLKQPQKRKSEFPQPQRTAPGTQLRLPGRSDGRPLEADLIQLSERLAEKENMLQKEIEEKTQQHRRWNQGHVDLTRDPLSPANGHGPETGFRPATAQYQYLMTPPSSVTSESFDHPSPAQEKQESFAFRYSSPPEEEPRGQPAYRRRIGRGGRLWIDRRGMSSAIKNDENMSDRWKYDQDDEEEQPVYEMDPHDTNALRFRATIPFPPHFYPQHGRQDNRPRAPGPNPANSRAIAPVQNPAAPP
ncbi:Enhancer of polycomb-like protein 1 [Lachnellula cervina]|uniref:Enhancer of polycomb-like protein n=1 Tax=Lachnellula cervina TaxID=1316786 RepID=A0A7D8UTY0_9HELO|nr:Enhancer of polycomb-like protein 1 [Lachnellula cervina]